MLVFPELSTFQLFNFQLPKRDSHSYNALTRWVLIGLKAVLPTANGRHSHGRIPKALTTRFLSEDTTAYSSHSMPCYITFYLHYILQTYCIGLTGNCKVMIRNASSFSVRITRNGCHSERRAISA